jgi:hypothetical protein
MRELADEGFVLIAGPLAGSEQHHLRVPLIVAADTEREVQTRIAGDPRARSGQLWITSVEPWNIFVGERRLSIGGSGGN